MASAITHFLVGAALGLPARFDGVLPRWAVPLTCGLLGAAPDLDTPLMFALDLPRGSLFAHRGFFHSPFFLALLCGALAAAVTRGRSWGALAALWTACAVTHPLLDMLTDGGSGVMLLFPFSPARLFFPWTPIRVSPLGISGFFDRAGDILWSEAPFDGAAVAIGWSARWMKSASRGARGLS